MFVIVTLSVPCPIKDVDESGESNGAELLAGKAQSPLRPFKRGVIYRSLQVAVLLRCYGVVDML